MLRGIQIDSRDNVAVLVQETGLGEKIIVGNKEIEALHDIPVGHKISVQAILKGEWIVKYGVRIGKAERNIQAGEHVHTQNVEDLTAELCKQYEKEFREKGE